MGTPATTSHLLAARELRAWRGLLRTHARLVKALDAELEAEHGLGVTSYEVLLYLADAPAGRMRMHDLDRKSTRLNSSHANISYAVFCLKKKKTITIIQWEYHGFYAACVAAI